MIAFGALYYIMPRVVDWEWSHPRLISVHFWTTALGIGAYWVALTIGGVEQGVLMLDPEITFNAVVDATKPWLWARTLSGILLTVGHLAFAFLLYKIVWRKGSPAPGPRYFRSAPAGAFPSRPASRTPVSA